jgi:beta-glucuronidase
MLYPILTESRLLSDLSGVWDFKLDNGKGFDEKWYEAPLKDADTMPVPASYNDLKEGADFRDHYGWVFYQRNISVPSYVKSQRIVLRCAAVTHYAKIYLNGNLICEHKGGFLPFEVELNDVLEDGDNLLTIAVNNVIDYTTLPVGGKANMMSGLMGGMGAGASEKPQNNPNFDFFNYCGITRPVKIYTTPKTYINDITVTSDIDFGKETPSAVLNYDVDIEGVDKDSTACKVEVFDAEGNKVAEAAGTQGKLELENVKLWQPLNSYLYQIKVTAGEDVYTLPYGVRSVRVDGVKFLINEKPFYFKGYGKHEDTFPNGRGINLPMNTKDISIMKWQHANSFRTSHYPYSEEMMRLCDEEGIVVIDETTAVGVNLQFGGGANFGGERIGTFDKEHGVQTQEHHKDVVRDLISSKVYKRRF